MVVRGRALRCVLRCSSLPCGRRRKAGDGKATAMDDEIEPRTWRRIYVATVAYGVLTIAVLWWFTAVFD